MILRITLGSAARSRSRRGDPRQRCGSAQKVSEASAGTQRAVDQQLQLEVREGVADHARHRPPLRPHRRRAQRLVRRAAASRPSRSRAPPACRRAARPPGAAAAARAPSSRSARKASPTRTGRSGLRRPRRQRALEPCGVRRAVALQRAHQARGPLGRAQAGAEVHQRLREIARALGRRQRARQAPDLAAWRPAAAVFTANSRATTRSMLPSTGVAARAEGDGRDRRRRVGADARQLAQLLLRLREAAAEARSATIRGALVQIAGAAVVAEPRPGREHVVERRRGQRLHRRPARQEALVEGDDRADRGLLQHDLGQPDRVGVRLAPRRRPPRQIAPLAVVPVEQAPAASCGPASRNCSCFLATLGMGLQGLVPAAHESSSAMVGAAQSAGNRPERRRASVREQLVTLAADAWRTTSARDRRLCTQAPQLPSSASRRSAASCRASPARPSRNTGFPPPA